MSDSRKLNWKASPADARDYIARPTVPARLPTTIDLSQACTTVKDQGALGSCTAFACVGMMEYFLRKNGVKINDDLLSELFLYYNSRVLVEGNVASDDSGAYLRDVLTAMVKYGVCVENLCPYSRNLAAKPTALAYRDGLNYQVVKYATIPTSNPTQALTDLKSLLSNGQVFVGGVLCFSNFFNSVGGLIPKPVGNIIGGHALLFVGYDDVKKVFKFKNSWSPSWGDKGYGYLPYEYLTSGYLWDLWTIYGQEYANTLVSANGAVVPPTVRQQELCDRLALILTTGGRQDAQSSLPLACVGSVMSKLKQDIQQHPNNVLLSPSDVTELSNLVTSIANLVKGSQAKMGVKGVAQ